MIKNITKNKTLAKHAIECKSIFDKSIGLMFSSEKKMKDKALVFYSEKEEKTSIHMLFVFYPIDVIWLDSQRRVTETKTLWPFTMHCPKHKAKYIIELNKEIIKKTGTEKGDTIEWQTE